MMRKNKYLTNTFLAISLVSFCALAKAETKKYQPAESQTGIASYFNDKYHGQRTASGEPYNKFALTAAHASLPFGTLLHVVNLRNNHSVDVRVNSRVHHANKRLLDLSRQTAKELGFIQAGTTKIAITILRLGEEA
jgi:rare lipoprotein A